MKFISAKWIALSVVTTVAFACASSSTTADACCGFFSCLFGCGGGSSCCRPAYPCSPCGPSGCATTTYYGPVGCGSCYSGSCSTGNCATGNCATGNCAISDSTGVPSPVADPTFKKKGTYSNENSLGSEGTIERNDSDQKKKIQGTDTRFQSPTRTEEKEESPSGNKDSTRRKSPAAPRADSGDDNDEEQGRRAPLINLDDRVAWRSAPVRTRSVSKTQTASARINRVSNYPKSEWIPVGEDSKVAKK